jgi:hypothetical protein
MPKREEDIAVFLRDRYGSRLGSVDVNEVAFELDLFLRRRKLVEHFNRTSSDDGD